MPPEEQQETVAAGIMRNYWKEMLVIFFCVAVVFGQSVHFDFVTYDDYELVYQNGDYLANISNLVHSFTTHAFTTHRSESAYYRPLLLVSFIIDYQFWKLNPVGYHLVNVLLHLITVVMAFLLIYSFLSDRTIALFSSLLFALHPVQTESVAWIAGRNDVLLGLFIVLMMVFYARSSGETEKGRRNFLLSVVCYGLALFTKESAAFYLLLLPLYDIFFGRFTVRALVTRRYVVRMLAPAGVLIVYFVIRFGVFGTLIGAEQLYGQTSIVGRLTQVPALIVEHCRLVLFPSNLSVIHPLGDVLWLTFPWSVIAVLFVGLGIYAVSRAWKKDRVLCFGLLWFAVGLIPALNIFPLAVPILEHRLYLPMVGVAIFTGRDLQLLMQSYQRQYLFAAMTVVLLTVCGVISFLRMPVWQNSETMWMDAIANTPGESRPYFNLAGYYFEHQHYDKTITLLKKYIELKPDDFLGYSKLRQTYLIVGQPQEAAMVCRGMIARNPTNPHRYIELGKLYEQLNMLDSARTVYQEGLRADTTSDELCFDLGVVTEKLGDRSAAEQLYKQTIQRNPRHPYAYFGLGYAAAKRGEDAQAVALIENGMKFGDPPKNIVQLLIYLYQKTGRAEDAKQLSQRFQF